MKRIGLIFVLCLLASADIVQARQASDKVYKGGNFTLEFGAFTSAGSKISFTGFSLTPVGGYTFSEHLFLGGGVSFCFNTVDNFFSMSMPVFVRGKYSLLKSRITPYVLLDAGYDPLFVSVNHEISESYVPSHGDLWIYGTRGGFYIRPELGVSLRLRRRKSVNFGIGYSLQRGDFKRMELQNGSIEALAVAKGNAEMILDSNPDLMICPWEFEVAAEYEANVILITKGETALLNVVNKALAKAYADGLYGTWYEDAVALAKSENAAEVSVED